MPKGELQFAREDFLDCATRSPGNVLAEKFTYADQKGIMLPVNREWGRKVGYASPEGIWDFSDRYTAVKSGTTRQGNSLVAPIHSIHRDGLIPKSMLPQRDDMTWEEYHNPQAITPSMEELGREFTRRFTINYEKVHKSGFADAIKNDLLCVAGFGWPLPIEGIYPYDPRQATHAFALFAGTFFAFDNYLDQYRNEQGFYREIPDDFVKQLATDFNFYDWGYRVFVSSEQVADSQHDALLENPLVRSFLDLLRRLGITLGGRDLTLTPTLWEQLKRILVAIFAPQTPPAPPDGVTSPLPEPVVPEPLKTPSHKLYDAAYAFLGTDASPEDIAPDELGCAESVNFIHMRAFSDFIDTKGVTSTNALYKALTARKDFAEVNIHEPGVIIISPTGYGKKLGKDGKLAVPHGHVGIFDRRGMIMSNDSDTGTFECNYSIEAWVRRFRDKGGYPIKYFKKI